MASKQNPETPFVQDTLFEDAPKASEVSILADSVEVILPTQEKSATMEDVEIDEARSERLQDQGFTVGQANAMSVPYSEAVKDKRPKPKPKSQKRLPPRKRTGFSAAENRIADGVPNFDPDRRW
jgi:hypothetical protein